VSPPVSSLPTVGASPPPQIDEDRVAMSKEALKHAFLDNLFYIQGKFPALATKTDYYMALAYAVRDRMLQRWISTAAAYTKQGSRTVAYLSAEFLMGPHLGNNLINLGIYETARTAVAELGLDLEELLAHEDEPGLGNGGLGRRNLPTVLRAHASSIRSSCTHGTGRAAGTEFVTVDAMPAVHFSGLTPPCAPL
jgi:hypothetical protein